MTRIVVLVFALGISTSCRPTPKLPPSPAVAPAANRDTVILPCPNGAITVRVGVANVGTPAQSPYYAVALRGRPLIARSELGLEFQSIPPFAALVIRHVEIRSVDRDEPLIFGKTSMARDRYREAVIDLVESAAPARALRLIFRAYDDGVAFRYALDRQAGMEDLSLVRENSEFTFAGAPTIHALQLDFRSPYEGKYRHARETEWPAGRTLGLPLAATFDDGAMVTVSEADLRAFPHLYLTRREGGRPGLGAELAPVTIGEPLVARIATPWSSPWRVMIIGAGARAAIESNLITLLSAPSAIDDVSWIHPGKILFQWWNGYVLPGPRKPRRKSHPEDVLNTQTLLGHIDFCARFGIEYASLDGYEFSKAWYGGTVLPWEGRDLTKPADDIDVPAIMAHAKAAGVRIRIWFHGKGLTRENMEALFATYERWGAAGVMIDFFDDDSQAGVMFAERILQTAARHHLTVSFHGVAKPTGLARTYPNLLTEEAVMGAEYDKWPGPHSTPEHEVAIAIIRGSVGPMDTHAGGFRPVPPKAFHPRAIAPNVIGTLARQLAMYVVYENPQPMLVDDPASYLKHEGAFAFVREVPVTWDETRWLAGGLKEGYIVVARRKGRDWYIGGLTGYEPRELTLKLDFLEARVYSAQLYRDRPESANDGEAIAIETRPADSGTRLRVKLAPAGGVAIHLQPGAHRPSLRLRSAAAPEPRAVNRRNFLRRSAAGVAALALPRGLAADTGRALEGIGVQLYTVRDLMERDFEGTLAKVAAVGYKDVETAGYFGRTGAQVRDAMRRAGLNAPSAHVPLATLGEGWEQTLADAHIVGHQYLVMPWLDEEYRGSLDSYRRIAERLNRAGEAAKKAGIGFAYHNHDFEFHRIDGRLPYDLLLQETDAEHVHFEMDLYWITKGGQDPLAYFARWPGRFPMVHVKDSAGPPKHEMADVGSGVIDWKRILARRAEAGIRHCFVERDDPPNPIASIAASYGYLQGLRF